MDREFTTEEMEAFLLFTAERDDLGLWTHSVAEMSGPRRTFVLIWELEAQVCNGGFSQYAFNSSGEGAPYVIDALVQIEAHATAELTQKALSLIGETSWHNDDVRQAHVEALSEDIHSQLDDLDQTFFKFEEPLSPLLFAYVVKNISEFPHKE